VSSGATSRSRESLDADIMAWMRESPQPEVASGGGPESGASAGDARFDALARELFGFQFERCIPYQRFCKARGTTPDSVGHWSQIPAVPTGAFKEVALRCFPPEREHKVFRTSGTAAGRRGELHLDTLELYEASLLPTLHRFLFPDLRAPTARASGPRTTIRVLAPSPEEVPDSSLSHMLGCALEAFGDEQSGYDMADGRLDLAGLAEHLAAAHAAGRPVALCGTAFAFVHLLEGLETSALDPMPIALAPGSRIMETGGFKGKAREVPRQAFYAALEASLGVPRSHIVNQYGMTELGSQFYDSSLRDALVGPSSGPRRKLGPPWVRVRIVDPETGREAEPGAPGMIVIHDLANTGSVAAIETADLGRRIPAPGDGEDGFEVAGREPGAEERGCSIAADAMLADAAPGETPWAR
jgi:hypothetical protein